MLTHDSSRTPKDTLLTLNTCIRCGDYSPQPYNVLGLVLRHPDTYPSTRLSAGSTRNKRPMRITQSISLSNIQTFSLLEEGPPSGGGKPATQSRKTGRLFPDRRHLQKMAAIGKQRMSLVELSGIEPLTPCLQSRCSPN